MKSVGRFVDGAACRDTTQSPVALKCGAFSNYE